MGNRKTSAWSRVPWGWVLVSVYCTALVCVGVSQLTSQDAAIAFVKDFQTLIAGVATVVALFIAAQQLKRQVDRDAIDAKRHHQVELDALTDLRKAATRLAAAAERRPDLFDAQLPYDRPHWDRLRNVVHPTVSSSVSSVMNKAETYNGLVAKDQEPTFGGGLRFGSAFTTQYQEERARVYYASMLLLADVQKRRSAVLAEIEATS